MANTFEYAKIYQEMLDLQTAQQATSGWMEANAGQVRYNGGNAIKIPKLSLDGLGDYDRVNHSYPQGGVAFAFETETMVMDRACELRFDRNDVDETNFTVTAQNVMNEFQRLHVIPEIDAYRYSKIAAYVIANGGESEYTPDADTVFNQFITDLYAMMDASGTSADNAAAIVSTPVMGLLESALINKNRHLGASSIRRGDADFAVSSIDGVPLIAVNSPRMKTSYVFEAGSGNFGFTPDADAQNINWIIGPRTAPIAASKTDAVNVFAPGQHPNGDCWIIQFRKYHDLWIPENRINNIIVSVTPAPAPPQS
jgi:hypothetical protein